MNSEQKNIAVKTNNRILTKRGVIWLGQTCNQRCYFCYFINRIEDHKHPEHAFMSLEKSCHIADTLRNFYGNTAVDIQGGEPTVHKDILALITHCRDIGLYPTLITNGLLLAKPGSIARYRDAGLRDFLVSLHGIGDTHDEVVGVKGAYNKITAALKQMQAEKFPFRINCTMSKPVVPVIKEIAEKAIEYGALAMNYIAFNPFNDQVTGHRRTDTVAKYSEIMPGLTAAMDLLEEAGIEVNVRYMPLCLAEKRHRKNFYNYQQLSYDLHEWDYQSWLWTMMPTQMMKEGNATPPFKLGVGARRIYKSDPFRMRDNYEKHPLKMGIKYNAQHWVASLQQLLHGKKAMYRAEAIERADLDCGYTYDNTCSECNARFICDGFHSDYADFFGMQEVRPITDIPKTIESCQFIKEQEKVVLAEDQEWAL